MAKVTIAKKTAKDKSQERLEAALRHRNEGGALHAWREWVDAGGDPDQELMVEQGLPPRKAVEWALRSGRDQLIEAIVQDGGDLGQLVEAQARSLKEEWERQPEDVMMGALSALEKHGHLDRWEAMLGERGLLGWLQERQERGSEKVWMTIAWVKQIKEPAASLSAKELGGRLGWSEASALEALESEPIRRGVGELDRLQVERRFSAEKDRLESSWRESHWKKRWSSLEKALSDPRWGPRVKSELEGLMSKAVPRLSEKEIWAGLEELEIGGRNWGWEWEEREISRGMPRWRGISLEKIKEERVKSARMEKARATALGMSWVEAIAGLSERLDQIEGESIKKGELSGWMKNLRSEINASMHEAIQSMDWAIEMEEDWDLQRVPGMARAKKIANGGHADPMDDVGRLALEALTGEKRGGAEAVMAAKKMMEERLGCAPGVWRELARNEKARERVIKELKRMAEQCERERFAKHRMEALQKEGPRPPNMLHEFMMMTRMEMNGMWGRERNERSAEQTLREMMEAIGRAKGWGLEGDEVTLWMDLNEKLAASEEWKAWKEKKLPRAPRGLDESDQSWEQLEEEVRAVQSLSEPLMLGLARQAQKKSKEGVARETVIAQLVAKWNDVIDMSAKLPAGFWGQLDERKPWESALKAHDRWVEALAEKELESVEVKEWAPLMSEPIQESSGWSAVEIHSAKELFKEGKELGHCVFSYADKCERGASRILSIKKRGERFSTLELIPIGTSGEKLERWDWKDAEAARRVARWEIAQHRGKRNGVVSETAALSLAERAQKEINLAWARKLGELEPMEEALPVEKLKARRSRGAR